MSGGKLYPTSHSIASLADSIEGEMVDEENGFSDQVKDRLLEAVNLSIRLSAMVHGIDCLVCGDLC